MFRDEAVIEVHAGKGGDGLVSFRREKYVPRGGPDGGDGGDGGSVVLVASEDESSLLRVGRQYRYSAEGGRPGGTKKCAGRGGEDVEVAVPVGTLIYDAERGNLLRDLAEPGARLVVAEGGKGGLGNVHFANAVRQVPRLATKGKPGERRELRLELKLFADVGLVGLPNAGKSTFLSAVTAARPKIADYPFTTLDPQVGIADLGEGRALCLADLPGLIEGAAEGHGLGHRFLKHVERCRVLLHLVDVSPSADTDPVQAYRVILAELEEFSPELFAKPRLLVATKCEGAEGEAERVAALEAEAGARALCISAVRREGLRAVLESAWAPVAAARG
ncbi:MAG: GTPase ObgE [Planctomycetes bacterium]|nr:GTPase ObgE [Planctomycetota bacterium]